MITVCMGIAWLMSGHVVLFAADEGEKVGLKGDSGKTIFYVKDDPLCPYQYKDTASGRKCIHAGN